MVLSVFWGKRNSILTLILVAWSRALFSGPTHTQNLTYVSYELSSKQDMFACNFCGNNFYYFFILKEHLIQKHEELLRRYKCKYCQKRYIKLSHLKNHIDAIHFEKTFTCFLCKKIYRYKRDFDKHMRKAHKCSLVKRSSSEDIGEQRVIDKTRKRPRKGIPRQIIFFQEIFQQ